MVAMGTSKAARWLWKNCRGTSRNDSAAKIDAGWPKSLLVSPKINGSIHAAKRNAGRRMAAAGRSTFSFSWNTT